MDKFFVLILIMFNIISCQKIVRMDPLALLSATLRTYQKAACDTDQVVIACPRGTSISIEFAQYNKFSGTDGVSIEELCRTGNVVMKTASKSKGLLRAIYSDNGKTLEHETTEYINNSITNDNEVVNDQEIVSTNAITSITNQTQVVNSEELGKTENCMWPNAMQTVVEACQKKKHCKFNSSLQGYRLGASGVGDASGTSSYTTNTTPNITDDPCPQTRKIVEVAYKCRPYEFRSKVACHNDVAQLECNPYSRIAIYSASFGRTEYESIQCPQPLGVREETCLAKYATETVMQICHGRRRCNLAADANTFGSPCQPSSRMYLKVVYTCVPKQVLKDRYDSETTADEPEHIDGEINDLYDEDLNYKESEAIPKLYSNSTSNTVHNYITTKSQVPSSLNDSNITDTFDPNNEITSVITKSVDINFDDQEYIYIITLIVCTICLVIVILFVMVRIILRKPSNTNPDTLGSSTVKDSDADTPILKLINTKPDNDPNVPIILGNISKSENMSTGSFDVNIVADTANNSNLYKKTVIFGPVTNNPASDGFYGHCPSPDIIGLVPSSMILPQQSQAELMNGILAPVIAFNRGELDGSSVKMVSTNSALGTLNSLPTTTIAGYAASPIFVGTDCTINSEGKYQQTCEIVPTSSIDYQTQKCQQQFEYIGENPLCHLLSTSTLPRKSAVQYTAVPQQQLVTYDGTAPRTLSTGLPISSSYYYK